MRSVRVGGGVRVGVAGGLVCLAALGLASVSLARAARAPSVSFFIAQSETAGQSLHFTYRVRRATKGSVVDFQVQQGGGWQTTKKLRSRSGNGTAPALSIGSYTVRLAVLKRGRVQASQTRPVLVYGPVPLSALCNASNAQWQNNAGGCNPSTTEVGQNLFASVVTFQAPASSNPAAPAPNLTVSPVTSCRSLHLDFGESNADNEHAGGNMMITQAVVQSNTAPVSVTFAGGALQHADIKLDGGPFQITDESSTYTGSGSLSVLENGSLDCYTSDGTIPGAS